MLGFRRAVTGGGGRAAGHSRRQSSIVYRDVSNGGSLQRVTSNYGYTESALGDLSSYDVLDAVLDHV